MPLNTTIPLTTLDPNAPIETGTYTVKNSDSQIILAVDRTVANGLNSQTEATKVNININMSNDGGNTWLILAGAGLLGGVTVDRSGATIPTSDVRVGLDLVKGTLLKGEITCNTPVAVSGTLTVT